MIEVRTHQPGANITLMNTLSGKFTDESGKTQEGLILVYKDVDTGIKYIEEFENPLYTFYVANPDKRVSYNRLFVDKADVHPIECSHRAIEREIAKVTNNMTFYKQNVDAGDYKANSRLHMHPDIFRSDMHLEDYYRFEFGRTYVNDPCSISKSYIDIETDGMKMSGDFPQLGECPINAVTLVMQHTKQVYVFLLETEGNDLIPEFKKQVQDGTVYPELRDFIIEQVHGIENAKKFGIDDLNYNFLFYKEEDEILLISDIFAAIHEFKPDFCMAWNMSFDIPYIIERIKVLGYKPEDIMCHKDFSIKYCYYFIDEMNKNDYAERGDYARISSYTAYIDMLIQYASRRKGQTKPLSFSLDYTGEKVVGVRKLDYKNITTNINELPYKNFKVFTFYNIMDSVLLQCIESKTGDIDYMFSKALLNDTRYAKVHRQTVYLANRGIKEFDKEGFIMGNNVNKWSEKPKTKFPGAFVADMQRLKTNSATRIGGMPVRLFDNLVDMDYASLYPSEIRQFNIATHTQIGYVNIPVRVGMHENRQNDPSYSRGGQFLEDMQSNVWLEVGTRWFNLPNFTELVDYVEDFYTNYVIPSRGLRIYDRDGLINPLHFMKTDKYMVTPLVFDPARDTEKFVKFDYNRAKEWRAYASANVNQQFR